ncbi:hypothetical protein ACWGII_37890 [Streptomyces sp. NPDC054855]
MSAPQHYWNGLRVPYIAPWTHERQRPGTIVRSYSRNGPGIGYRNEHPSDRRDGVLWMRMPAVPGGGRPQLGDVHALRQRRAMTHLLCQVCAASTIGQLPDELHLFLVRAPDGRPIAEGETTTAPPLCVPCAVESVVDCPHLRQGYAAALVEYAPFWGVAGIVHDPATLQPLPDPDGHPLTLVPYTDEHTLHHTLAARLAVSLHGCTTVDLDDLTARRGYVS